VPEQIPTRGDLPFFDLLMVLEGVTYTLECRYNVRDGSWYMNVLDEQGVGVLQAGLKLIVNYPLGAYTTGRTPPGVFVAVDTSGQEREIESQEDLGSRVQLWYFTAEELGLG
jgi:hypothetical protein